jgi:hypothetical protein
VSGSTASSQPRPLGARLAALALVAVLCGCAGGSSSGGGPTPAPSTPSATSSPGSTSSPAPSAGGQVGSGDVVVTDHDRGSTVRLRPGQTLVVQLGSTQWQDPQASGPVLTRDGVDRAGSSPCIAGGGCGTTTARFTAGTAGTATVSATRLSCGEARACVGDEGSFSVTVVVS